MKHLSHVPVNSGESSGTVYAICRNSGLGFQNATRRHVKDWEKYMSDTFLPIESYSLFKAFSCRTNFMKCIWFALISNGYFLFGAVISVCHLRTWGQFASVHYYFTERHCTILSLDSFTCVWQYARVQHTNAAPRFQLRLDMRTPHALLSRRLILETSSGPQPTWVSFFPEPSRRRGGMGCANSTGYPRLRDDILSRVLVTRQGSDW
jgi:hypothetical protein